VSQVTAKTPFGKGNARAHIRDAFYAELDSGQTPDIHQVAALREDYGPSLHRLARTLRLSRERSAQAAVGVPPPTARLLLPNVLYDPLVMVPWVPPAWIHTPDLDHTQPLAMLIRRHGLRGRSARLDRLNRKALSVRAHRQSATTCCGSRLGRWLDRARRSDAGPR